MLLDNALRHGSGRRCASTVSADGRVARITVADGGPGIPDEERDRIFERGASRAGGTGIGLHLARALAQADSGGLRVLERRADALRAAAAAAVGCVSSRASASFGQASDGAARVGEQLLGDRAAVDDRVAPVVELDPLGEQLGAEAVPGAGDRVDLRCALTPRPCAGVREASRSVGGRRQARHGPALVVGELLARRRAARCARKRTAPSGRWQAPRPGRSRLQRSSSCAARRLRRAPGGHRGEQLGDRRQAVAARPALAGALPAS